MNTFQHRPHVVHSRVISTPSDTDFISELMEDQTFEDTLHFLANRYEIPLPHSSSSSRLLLSSLQEDLNRTVSPEQRSLRWRDCRGTERNDPLSSLNPRSQPSHVFRDQETNTRYDPFEMPSTRMSQKSIDLYDLTLRRLHDIRHEHCMQNASRKHESFDMMRSHIAAREMPTQLSPSIQVAPTRCYMAYTPYEATIPWSTMNQNRSSKYAYPNISSSDFDQGYERPFYGCACPKDSRRDAYVTHKTRMFSRTPLCEFWNEPDESQMKDDVATTQTSSDNSRRPPLDRKLAPPTRKSSPIHAIQEGKTSTPVRKNQSLISQNENLMTNPNELHDEPNTAQKDTTAKLALRTSNPEDSLKSQGKSARRPESSEKSEKVSEDSIHPIDESSFFGPSSRSNLELTDMVSSALRLGTRVRIPVGLIGRKRDAYLFVQDEVNIAGAKLTEPHLCYIFGNRAKFVEKKGIVRGRAPISTLTEALKEGKVWSFTFRDVSIRVKFLSDEDETLWVTEIKEIAEYLRTEQYAMSGLSTPRRPKPSRRLGSEPASFRVTPSGLSS